MKPIITRFPPSPTGFLHVGGLRTALYAYLSAKKSGGEFMLRIEDTDRARLVEGATVNIVEALHWAGLTMDRGVDMDENGNIVQKGDHGPYIQSERKEAGIYQEYIEKLLESGDAYYAFDSSEELDAMRAKQQEAKQPPRYDRDAMTNQLTLGDEEAKRRVEAGESYVIRLRMPTEGTTTFEDQIRGTVEFKNELIDDQILIKSDGYPTYHFAVVVDDHLMGVNTVIRGDEWISSVPKHIAIYNAFGWELPTYTHLPLLVNEKKQKLSKRHGDVSVEDFKEKGYLPEALLNFVAFLGWNPGDEREIFSLSELENEFSLEKVGKAPAVFNYEKLDWYNKQYIANMSANELAQRAESFFTNAGINLQSLRASSGQASIFNLADVVSLEQGRANTLLDIVENTGFVFAKELAIEPELLVWKKSTAEDAKSKLGEMVDFLSSQDNWNKEALEEAGLAWIAKEGYGNGDVLWPMRVALSGKKRSPGPFEIAAVLGKEETIRRMKAAIAIL